jgi:hypothetical protein
METVKNPEFQLAFDFIQFTDRNVFLTGKAGTGKTTFLHKLKNASPKRMIVVAPTGVAAINAGGVTIHSFFQLPFHPHVPSQYLSASNHHGTPDPLGSPSYKLSREKVNIIKSLDLLIIDEISMVRADLLDAVDSVLRRFRNQKKPFGGVQLLMIGDLQQLAPVMREEDRQVLDKYYASGFFFDSLALHQTDYVTIELQHVYRQKDLAFITLLNKIRDNQLDSGTLRELNSRYDPHFDPGSKEGYITLTTHNSQAQVINDSRLEKLPGRVHSFRAMVKDDFPEYAYPTAGELFLKTGAQVMFVKNDMSAEKLYFNGKMGIILDFEQGAVIVNCPEDEEPIRVGVVEWQNMKYTLDEKTREIQEKTIGTFSQYPLKLAWAITIHKSQGLTFDKVIIDSGAAFAHGQVYVALSRCRTLEGIVLSTPVSRQGIITDSNVSGFVREAVLTRPDREVLSLSKKAYQQALLSELFDFSSMQNNVYVCQNLVREYRGSIMGNMPEKLARVAGIILADLTGISGKFNPQLLHLLSLSGDAETNDRLQERISKACQFFAEKISGTLSKELDTIDLDTDNKEVRKTLTGALHKVKSDTALKVACLEACTTGFTIKKYLEAKARTFVEIPHPKAKKAKAQADIAGEIKYPELLNRIRSWRDLKALATGLPHYMILPQKTMASLACFLPQNMSSLLMVKGMGRKKSEQFGAELLEIIQLYCSERKIEPPLLIEQKVQKKAKVRRTDTRHVTYDLFKAGKTIKEIAQERGMAVTTIEEHLAHFVGTGDIPVEVFVSPGITMLIANHFEGQGDLRLAPVKAALGDQVSWSELRFVVKHLQHMGKI